MTRRVGRFIAAMMMWAAIGQIVVDRCLIRCHVDSSTEASTATPACHAAHAGGGRSQWQASAACNHDHRVSSAEAAAKIRPESPTKEIVHTLPSSLDRARAVNARATIAGKETPPPGATAAAAFARPLRV